MIRFQKSTMPIRAVPLVAAVLLLAWHGVAVALPVRFLPWDHQTASRKVGFQIGTAVTELKGLHPHKRSKTFQVDPGENSPLLLVAVDRKNAAGNPLSVEIKLPAGTQSPLVLIMSDDTHPSGLRAFVIEDNTSNFPWGSVRFFNTTTRDLAVRHHKTVVSLPKAWTPVDVTPGGGATNISVQMIARDKPDVLVYSAVWEQDPDIRKLVFIAPIINGGEGEFEFKIVPENRRTVEPEIAAKPR